MKLIIAILACTLLLAGCTNPTATPLPATPTIMPTAQATAIPTMLPSAEPDPALPLQLTVTALTPTCVPLQLTVVTPPTETPSLPPPHLTVNLPPTATVMPPTSLPTVQSTEQSDKPTAGCN